MAGDEVEIKFAVTEPSRLRRQLRQLGFRVAIRRRLERNWIFDQAGSLHRSGRLLRLRQSGHHARLTAKGPRQPRPGEAAALKRRREIEVAVSDPAACRALLALLGYGEQMSYVRHRTTFRRPGERGEVDWDETPFGVYAELEGGALWIRRTARELGLEAAQAEARSYPELYVQHSRRQTSR